MSKINPVLSKLNAKPNSQSNTHTRTQKLHIKLQLLPLGFLDTT